MFFLGKILDQVFTRTTLCWRN